MGARAFVSLHSLPDSQGVPGTWVHTTASPASRALAERIQGRLAHGYGGPAHPVGSGDLAVLHPQQFSPDTGACLVEAPFGGRPGQPAPVDHVADAVATGILEFLDGRTYGAGLATAQGTVLPDYVPDSPLGAIRTWIDWCTRYASWTVGVRDTRVFPHSAICYIWGVGTAFYIAPDRLLTAAHCVSGRTELTIIPGYNAGAKPYGEYVVRATGSDHLANWKVYPGYSGSGNLPGDMAVIRVPQRPPHDHFRLEVLEECLPDPTVVCGYSALEPPASRRQHLDADMVRWLSDDGEVEGYNLQTLGGASGSPVFRVATETQQSSVDNFLVHAVHVAGPSGDQPTLNRGCRITRAKLTWIEGLVSRWS
ncbi:MAG: trypsin-like peptidase domain-containing protein [Pseudomonadota bacterium]